MSRSEEGVLTGVVYEMRWGGFAVVRECWNTHLLPRRRCMWQCHTSIAMVLAGCEVVPSRAAHTPLAALNHQLSLWSSTSHFGGVVNALPC